jgi:hypothetical protein
MKSLRLPAATRPADRCTSYSTTAGWKGWPLRRAGQDHLGAGPNPHASPAHVGDRGDPPPPVTTLRVAAYNLIRTPKLLAQASI